MKVKVLSRNPDDFLRATTADIHKVPRNYSKDAHPFQEAREYTRALNATKLDRMFAKPFLANLTGHTDGVSVLAKHEQALSVLLSGSYDGEVRLWDLPRKRCLAHIQAHSGWIRGICVDPQGGDSFLTVGDDKQIKHWPLIIDGSKTGDAYPDPSFAVVSKSSLLGLSHHWTRPQFATCGDTVQVWDHHRASPVRTFDWGVDSVYRVKYNPVETELLGAVSSDRGIMLYDTRGQVPIKKTVMKLRSNAIVWNPMEAFVFTVANEDYNCYTFDMRKMSSPLNVHMDHTEAVMDLDYSPTGREIVTGSYDRSIRIFPLQHGRSREVYHTKRMQRVMTVSWSMDAKFIVSGSDEMNLRLWKANASEKLGPARTSLKTAETAVKTGRVRPREERTFRYQEKLEEKFAHHPEVKRIAKHRQVPKHIRNAAHEHRVIRESKSRKEANRRKHSKPGTVPYKAERSKHVLREED